MQKKQRAAAWLCSALLLLSLTACGGTPALSESAPSEATPSASAVVRDYAVTIPKAVSELTGVDIATTAKALNLDNVTKNEDGSYTVLMTQEEQVAIRVTLRESLDSELLALVESGAWPFLDSITVDASCQNATLQSEKTRYTPVRDDAVAPSIYIPTLLYMAFSGNATESFTMHFTVLDSDKKTVLSEFDYPFPAASPDPNATPDSSPEPTE